MATHDYVIANGTGAAVRSDLNGALAAIVSNNSSATEPATMYAYQWWPDTTTGLLKIRNAANNAWVTVGTLASANLGLLSLAGGTMTGALAVTAGTAALPGIAVSGDTNTGITSPGADQLAISTGGTSRLAVSTTAVSSTLAVDVPLGAAATPSITFTGDLNTGIYSPGADQLAISTGGTGRLFVSSAGLVGIGTSSPGAALDVNGAIRSNDILTLYKNSVDAFYIGAGTIITGGTSTDIALRSNQNGSVLFSTNGATERMRIDATGRVGIGTTSPGGTVDIKAAASTAPLIVQGPSSEFTRIDSSGRLLVGTSTARDFFGGTDTPALQVEGIGNAGRELSVTSSTASGSGGVVLLAKQRSGAVGGQTIVQSGDQLGYLGFQGSDGTKMLAGAAIEATVDGTPGVNDLPTRLVFSTTADGASSPTERMRITSGGYFKASNDGSYISTTSSNHEFVQNNTSEWGLQVYHKAAATGNNGIYINYPNRAPNDISNSFLYCNDSGALRAQLRSNGGLANYSTNNANLSDRNVKKDISLATDTWDCVKEWEIVNYRYKDQPDDADLNLGVIAQQVAESCPEVITIFQEAKDATEDKPAQEERLGVKEQQMYWMAIKALQEAMGRIEALETEVALLKAA